jgi:hypothetical protein
MSKDEKTPESLRDILLRTRATDFREETDKSGIEWAIITLADGKEIHFRAGAVIVYPETC